MSVEIRGGGGVAKDFFMPTYVYRRSECDQSAAPCDLCSAEFEMVQRMSDPALAKCPRCGAAVERVIQAPCLNGVGLIKKPSDERMAKAGFTQYRRCGKGYYEKSFGQGPAALHGDKES